MKRNPWYRLGTFRAALALAKILPRDAGQSVCNILDLDIERRWVKQIEPPAGQHALPGARPRSICAVPCHDESVSDLPFCGQK